MAIDSLSLSVLTAELNEKLSGGKISKIFQPERDEITLLVYSQKNYRVAMSANASLNRLHITAEGKENPLNAFNFCMLLRKHLLNAVIAGITQMPYERVVDFLLHSRNDLGYVETKHLIFELTGKTANIILCDENYIIYDSLKHLPLTTDSQRIILAGTKYEFFAERHLLTLNQTDEISRLIVNGNQSIDILLRENLLGVSSQTVSEILYGIDKDNHSALNCGRIVNGINKVLYGLSHPKPNVVIQYDKLVDVFPFDFNSVKGERKFFDTLNEAHDYFFAEKDRQLRFAQKAKSVSTSIKNAIARLEKKIGIQAQEIENAKCCEQNKLYGDLILANLYRIPKMADSVTVTDYTKENNPQITIPLTCNKSAQQNAQDYYKKYHKQKNTILFTSRLLKESRELLDYAQSIKQSLSLCDSPAELAEIYEEMVSAGFINGKRKENVKIIPSQPIKYEVNGFTVLVGKNNTQNDILTNKMAKPEDIWLHTQSLHSAHVIITASGKDIPESVILIAAQITAHYSQAKFGGKTAVDWCYKRYVKKPNKAKPGFVIYTDFSTLIVEGNQHLDFLK